METKTNKDHNLFFPASILTDKNLNAIDRMLLSVIASYDRNEGCYLSNADLGKFANCSEGTVSKSINKMYPKYICYNEQSVKYGGRRFVRKVVPEIKRKPA